MSRPKYLKSGKTENRRWTDEDLEEKPQKEDRLLRFLRSARVEECYRVLRDNGISFEDLRFLKESDVLELGFSIGIRNRFLNALDGLDGEQEELEEAQEVGGKLKEIWSVVSGIAKTQVGMMEAIRRCQMEIAEMQEESEVSEVRRSRETYSATSPKIQRIRKPTLSSIAKQNVIPNKYMQVSPLRASYYSRLMN